MRAATTVPIATHRFAIRPRSTRRGGALLAAAVLALALAACSGSSAKSPSAGVATPAAAGATASPSSGTAAPSPNAGAAPIFAAPTAPATPAAGAVPATPAGTPVAGKGRRPVAGNAQQVVQAFRLRGIPIGQVQDLSAGDDPDHLLGAPGGYTSKSVFTDTRLADGASPSVQAGGAVEYFADQRDAQRRFTQLQAAQKGGAQPEQLFHDGDVVLRLSPALKADQVSEYEITARRALAGR